MKMKSLEKILKALRDIEDFEYGCLVIKFQQRTPVLIEVVKTVGKSEKVVVT